MDAAGHPPAPLPDPPDEREVRRIVEQAVVRWLDGRRARVDGFVDRHFTLGGALRLHRRAVGWDVVRAPANLALAVPAVLARLSAVGLQAAGRTGAAAWLRSRPLALKTDVAAEIEWLIVTDLLELPYRQGARASDRDSLAEEILADPRLTEAVAAALQAVGRHADEPEFRARLVATLEDYTGARTAAADIATNLLTLGAGAAAFHQLTPGALSLGPAVAGSLAHAVSVGSFPLGAALGSMWYSMFPVSISPLLVSGVTGTLMAAAAVFAAFAGVIADPVQRRLGLHRRRLLKVIDVLEQQLLHRRETRLVVVDHYVARVMDLFDLLRTVYRIAR